MNAEDLSKRVAKCPPQWQSVDNRCMGPLRDLRRSLGLSQHELAARLHVSEETCRVWDSGRRPVPAAVLRAAQRILDEHRRDHEWLTFGALAREMGVNVQTLRAAARTGRLEARFDVRSVFGRPSRRATRAACRRFLLDAFRRRSGTLCHSCPLIPVPDDFDHQLKSLRGRLHLSQAGLAHRIGAAGKAVIYQWESRRRTPSPVLWKRIEGLIADA